MTIAYSGDNITFPDTTTQASAQVGLKNRVIDGGFVLNQRVYVSGTALASGVYAHDRWKAGASGCTYTFTQGALGVNTTITITAGSLTQIIEGCNVAEGGTYVLSWTGTAQGRLNGGTYGASGTVTITGWTPGTNLPIEFNTGTVGSVQLEKGSTATSFDYRPYGTELALCQRYYYRITGSGYFGTALIRSTSSSVSYTAFPVTMRINPTSLEQTGTAADYAVANLATGTTCTSVPTFFAALQHNAQTAFTTGATLVAGQAGLNYGTGVNSYLGWSAEL